MNRFAEIQAWYASHCDGEWEHTYGVRIVTLDNPGWWVKIDLSGTKLERADFTPKVEHRSETDWLHRKINKGAFNGSGDAMKLEVILGIFLDWAKKHEKLAG
jgi:hypothetical protein